MIQAMFFQGANVRRLVIKKNEVIMMSSETNYEPILLKLDEMAKPEVLAKIKGGHEWIEEIKKLKTEKEMLEDIRKDFKKTGWKLTLTREFTDE